MNFELILFPLITMILLFLAIFQSVGHRKKSKYMQERRKKHEQLREQIAELDFKLGSMDAGGSHKSNNMNSPFVKQLGDNYTKIKLMENETKRLREILENKSLEFLSEKEKEKPKKEPLRGNSFG